MSAGFQHSSIDASRNGVIKIHYYTRLKKKMFLSRDQTDLRLISKLFVKISNQHVKSI